MKKIILLFYVGSICTMLNAQIISTVAGNGSWGAYIGDGGPATSAILDDLYYTYPAFDSDGNMYFGQGGRHTIRKVDKFGIITTIAGQVNIIGYSGDGGPAINARIYRPTAMAVNKSNHLYFADQVSAVIRKIDENGVISTVSAKSSAVCGSAAGRHISVAGFGAIAAMIFDPFDNLIIADYGCDVIYKVDVAGNVTLLAGNYSRGYSGDGGPATSAALRYPCKPAVDAAGNLYIPDTQNHRIRKVTPAGIITTIAGTGIDGYSGDGGPATAATLSFPGSVVIDKAGNLYIGDNERLIRKIDPSGIITTFAGNNTWGYTGDGGPAIDAAIIATQGRISIDANDDLYFCDDRNFVIRKISNCLSSTYATQPVNDTLCTSGVAVFSVSVFNAVTLQWQENKGQGWSNLSNNAIYSGATSASLTVTAADIGFNNFQYRCVATNSCGDVYSQPVQLLVTTPAAPQLTITSTATTFCAGSPVTFTATPVNGGTAPVFQWKKNGINTGTNSSSYTDSNFVNGDVISCVLTSNASCLSTAVATSNAIAVTVNPLLVPAVSIQASATSICYGAAVTFTATSLYAGTAPAYQWLKNGTNVGSGTAVYTDNTFNNGDIISCVLTSNEVCKTNSTANSNSIAIAVTPLVTPTVLIQASATAICAGTNVQFAATITNGGTTPVFQWKKNGVNTGTNSAIYNDSLLQPNDVISCSLLSNANCLATSTAASNTVTITVFAKPVVNLDKSVTICNGGSKKLDAGSFADYLWQDGSTGRSITVNQLGTYSVTVLDNNGCTGSDTAIINTLLAAPAGFLMRDTSVCIYEKLTLKPNGNFTSYLWNNNTSGNSITVSQPGDYWLTVTDQNTCTGTDTVRVLPKDCITGIYVPNAFTPNGDYLNDELYPVIGGRIVKYEFTVFNRWGAVVFRTNEPGKGWNGMLKGIPQPPGMFTWKCMYQLEGDKVRVASGNAVLIR